MPLLAYLYTELIAELPAGPGFAVAARGWLEGCLAEVFGDLYGRLVARPVGRFDRRAAEMGAPLGEPGQVLGWLCTNRDDPVMGRRQVLYSARSWARALAALEESPRGTWIQMRPLDERGYPAHNSAADAVVSVERDYFHPEWVRFIFWAPAAGGEWAGSPAVQEGWARFVREQARLVGACAGSMTDDIGTGGKTALQRATNDFTVSIADSRRVLRGYSWVTVIAPELAARLGGVGALAGTGAFCEVEELADGAVWVRATPTVNEFTGDRVRRVFEALAPVLVTGTARIQFPASENYRLVTEVDAEDYR